MIVKDLQEQLLIKRAVDLLNKSEQDLPLAKLQATLTNIKVSDLLGKPLFPAYTFNKLEAIDFTDHNENVSALRADSEVVTGTLNWAQDSVDKLDRATLKLGSFIKDLASKLDSLIRRASLRLRVAARTISINFSSNEFIDTTNTTAALDLVNKICTLPSKTNISQVNMKDLSNDDITVRFDGGVPFGTSTEVSFILRPANTRSVSITAIDHTNLLKELSGSIRIQLAKDGVDRTINALTLETSNPDAVILRAQVYYGDNKSKEILPETIVTTGTYTHTFPSVDAASIEIFMTKKTVDYIDADERRFVFSFRRILLEDTAFQDEGIVQGVISGESIPSGGSITDVFLSAEHYMPKGSDIDYFVSSDGTKWIEIDPINIKESSRNVVSLGSKSTVSIDEITESNSSRWSILESLTEYGNKPLYNILEKSNDSDFVSGEIIQVDTTDEVDEASIRLMRGYDNYAIDKTILKVRSEVENARYIFTDSGTGTVGALDIFTRIENEAKIVRGDLTVELLYTPANTDIYVSDGTRKISIVDITDNVLELSSATGASVGEIVYITYYVTLRELEQDGKFIVEVEPNSFSAKKSPDDPTELSSTDYFVDTMGRFIILSENTSVGNSAGSKEVRNITIQIGNNPTDSTVTPAYRTMYVSFAYTIQTRDKYRIYSANVFYDEETDIVIYPFTEEEIKAGNFHFIDGVNVSSMTLYTMTNGWHEVRTTQPYKTDPNNSLDTNELTASGSFAGINLGEYEQMIAYEFPLRLVSTKALSNQVGPKDHRSFAYKNGRILLNFLPESLPEDINIYESQMKGTDLLCKKAVYTADSSFDYYEIIPDKFSLTLNIKRKTTEADAVKDIYFKARLTRDGDRSYQTPKISKIEISLL